MTLRKEITKKEEKLLKIFQGMGSRACKKKKKKDSRWEISLGKLCEVAHIDINIMSDNVKNRAECIVSQVCRAGSRFTKDCVCVQFEEDADSLMQWAVERGALAVVCRKQIGDLPCIVVDYPMEVYSLMCKYYRQLSIIDVTAVVGSIGKTTTKRMINSVYKQAFPTFCDPENENQLDCVGYICQHIPHKTKKLIQEVSEDTPGCVELISNLIEPKIAVVTAIDKSHIEAFGDQSKILDEIRSITKGIKEDGFAIINIDDEETKNLINQCKVVTVSMNNQDADFYAEDVEISKKGLRFSIVEKQGDVRNKVMLSYVYAKHNVYSALYTFAAGKVSGISSKKIINGLKKYRTVGIRQNVYKIRSNVLYLDCYNAALKSMKSAISAASEIPIKNRRIAVLGDIEEAGAHSEQIHKEVLEQLNDSNFNVAILLGNNFKKAAQDVSLRNDLKIIICESKQQVLKELKCLKLKNDLILFKSSRKSALEEIVSSAWPFSFRIKMLKYYLPIIRWRVKVTRS